MRAMVAIILGMLLGHIVFTTWHLAKIEKAQVGKPCITLTNSVKVPVYCYTNMGSYSAVYGYVNMLEARDTIQFTNTITITNHFLDQDLWVIRTNYDKPILTRNIKEALHSNGWYFIYMGVTNGLATNFPITLSTDIAVGQVWVYEPTCPLDKYLTSTSTVLAIEGNQVQYKVQNGKGELISSSSKEVFMSESRRIK